MLMTGGAGLGLIGNVGRGGVVWAWARGYRYHIFLPFVGDLFFFFLFVSVLVGFWRTR